MSTLLYTHRSSEAHDTGQGHPERPDRIRAVWSALAEPAFEGLDRREAPCAGVDEIARVHRRDYVTGLLDAVPDQGYARIDGDTVMSPDSGEAALRATGAMIAAIDAVIAGEARNAFCAIRPPGHHAEPARGMGFCLFNNVAIGAAHARAAHRVERVAVVDFDVHHGNGTQAAFWDDPSVLYASSHQFPLYPGSGAEEERGAGNIFNLPLAPSSGSVEFRRGMERIVLPALEDFAPGLILVSAGFDAHARDPLANLRLEAEDFAWITGKLVDLAGEYCDGRLVSTLEGGYDLVALAESATAHVTELMRG
ncbi:MAG: histone deacetylase family protein [Alphaproteobacteria bacterium]